MTREPKGRFIVLEGIDGSGTTTQARRLVETLERRGTEALLTCEPTNGPVGVLIRQALGRKLVGPGGQGSRELAWSTLALLFAADRLDHLDSVVLPALEAGTTVVSDRYDLSSVAYQSVTSPEGEQVIPWIRSLNARAMRPDLTVVLDVHPDVAAERRAARGGEPELYDVLETQRRLAAAYARAEEMLPGDRIVHVADGPPDDVAARVLAAASRGQSKPPRE